MGKVKKEKMPKKKKIILIVASVLAALIALSIIYYFGMGGFLYSFALDPASKIFTDQGKKKPQDDSIFLQDYEWWESHPKEELTITSDDGFRLVGYQFMASEPSAKWAAVFHGYRGNARQMATFVKKYLENGYNVFAPDLRAHGKSEGNLIGMGWLDRFDVVKWLNFLVEKHSNTDIVLHGVSMGGATVMMTTGEILPKNVKVAVEDCGYTTVYEQFKYVVENSFGAPAFLALPQAETMVSLKKSYNLKTASSLTQLAKSITPTLFIHGTEDTFVPYYMLQQNYRAAACEKDYLEVEGAPHARSAATAPEIYWDKVFEFIAKYM